MGLLRFYSQVISSAKGRIGEHLHNRSACSYGDLSPRPNYFQLKVLDYNTYDKVVAFEAHPDYIWCVAVHPTLPLIFTSGDD